MAAVIVLGCGVLGCAGNAEEGETACLDLADAMGSRAQACGQDYQATFDAIVDTVAVGDCANIIQVRDVSSYYADCLPFIRQLTCQQLNDPQLKLPAACEKQLLREP